MPTHEPISYTQTNSVYVFSSLYYQKWGACWHSSISNKQQLPQSATSPRKLPIKVLIVVSRRGKGSGRIKNNPPSYTDTIAFMSAVHLPQPWKVFYLLVSKSGLPQQKTFAVSHLKLSPTDFFLLFHTTKKKHSQNQPQFCFVNSNSIKRAMQLYHLYVIIKQWRIISTFYIPFNLHPMREHQVFLLYSFSNRRKYLPWTFHWNPSYNIHSHVTQTRAAVKRSRFGTTAGIPGKCIPERKQEGRQQLNCQSWLHQNLALRRAKDGTSDTFTPAAPPLQAHRTSARDPAK